MCWHHLVRVEESALLSVCADNASVNDGRHNSVFQKLRAANPHILKGNCKCHVINNTVKTANRILSAGGRDVEAFVLKMYREFSCSPKKVELLKDFCEFTNTKYKAILRHVPTRWLGCQKFRGFWRVGRL